MPEKISMTLAYYHFIMAAAPPAVSETADESLRRTALLTAAGLGPTDVTAFDSSLSAIRGQLELLAESKRQASESDLANTTYFKTQEGAVIRSARARLQTSLSEQGAAALDGYVSTHVRRHIKIYGTDTAALRDQ